MSKAIARITTTLAPFASLTPANDAGPVIIDSPNFDAARTGKAHRLAALFDKAEADARAFHDAHPRPSKLPQNPYATHYGKITDQPRFTAWDMGFRAAERFAREIANGEAQ